MIDRQGGVLVIECDECAATHEGDSGEWGEVWPEARRLGWTARKIDEEWIHRCPECA